MKNMNWLAVFVTVCFLIGLVAVIGVAIYLIQEGVRIMMEGGILKW